MKWVLVVMAINPTTGQMDRQIVPGWSSKPACEKTIEQQNLSPYWAWCFPDAQTLPQPR